MQNENEKELEAVEEENNEEKVDNEVYEQKPNYFEIAIKEYLDNFSKSDSFFAEKYADENKSITKCCNFICNTVHAMNVQGLTDDEVYQLARHYYLEDIKESDTNNISCKVVVNHDIILSEEEKKQAKANAIKRYENECLEKEIKKRAKQAEKQKSKEKDLPIQSTSLFDFMGE